MSLSGAAAQRVMKELRGLMSKPPEGIKVHVNEANISTIIADIDGPVDTPFAGGVFRCKLVLGADFPASPPKGYFVTKVFHPNVSAAGEICVNTLKRDWSAAHGLAHVLVVIRCLLIEPNPASALNEEAGKLLLEEYDAYFKRAQLMTRIHAKPGGAAAAAAAGTTAAPAKPTDAKANAAVAPAAANAAAEKVNAKAGDSTEETKKLVIEKDNKENAAASAAIANATPATVAPAGATSVPGAPTSSSAAAAAGVKKPAVAATAAPAAAKPAPAVSAAAAAANAKKKALKRL